MQLRVTNVSYSETRIDYTWLHYNTELTRLEEFEYLKIFPTTSREGTGAVQTKVNTNRTDHQKTHIGKMSSPTSINI